MIHLNDDVILRGLPELLRQGPLKLFKKGIFALHPTSAHLHNTGEAQPILCGRLEVPSAKESFVPSGFQSRKTY